MAWRVVRRRGQIGIQEFLQFRTRIPYRSGEGTSEGNGGVCVDRSDFGLAGALHGRDGSKTAEQGPSVELAALRIPDRKSVSGIIRVVSVSRGSMFRRPE